MTIDINYEVGKLLNQLPEHKSGAMFNVNTDNATVIFAEKLDEHWTFEAVGNVDWHTMKPEGEISMIISW